MKLRTPSKADERAKKRALATLVDCRTRLVAEQPMLASLALHLELVPAVDERLSTASTDGVQLAVNPYFLESLQPAEQLFVVSHEVWHCALLHFSRRQGRDAEAWNVAADHEINALLREEDGFEVPAWAVHFPRLVGMSAEQVYESFAESRSDRDTSAHGLHLPHQGEAELPTVDRRPEHGPIAGKRDPAFSTRMRADAAEKWRDRIVAAASEDRWGVAAMPSALRRVLSRIAPACIPWRLVLQQFITRTSAGEQRWTPPSRRHFHRGLYLPSRRSDHLRLAVAIDTSGSTWDYVPAFLAELSGILRSCSRYDVHLLLCDTSIHDELYFSDSFSPDIKADAIGGGGGTDFRPVFRRLADESPTALAFMTDGYGPAPAEAPAFPVLWALTPNGRRPAGWGATIMLDGS